MGATTLGESVRSTPNAPAFAKPWLPARMWAALWIGFVIGGALGVLGWSLFGPRAVPATSGTFPQQAYLWQRQWTENVRAAVAWAGAEHTPFDELCVAYAEIGSGAAGASVVLRTANLDWAALSRCRTAVGVAVRVREFPGEVSAAKEPFPTLCNVIRELCGQAGAAGVPLAEIQVDFDCPTSRLRGFADWLRVLRQTFPAQTFRFTALPAWLRSRDFLPLAEVTGGYILQLHWLDKPGADGRPPATLCDPARARAAVDRAARLGVPFRVALPTYGYRLVLNGSGGLLAAAGEGAALETARPPPGGSSRALQADPAALADLVHGWQVRRPAAMKGVIWYRLPVDGERLNWTARTLLAVMAGRTPQPRLALRFARGPGTEPYELRLCNEGEADASLPPSITVRCPSAPQSADGAGGFDLQPGDDSPRELVFTRRAEHRADARSLPAGSNLLFGWVRLDDHGTAESAEALFTGRVASGSSSP